MCGIVGYIGYDNAKELLLKGLEKLEYRGYDSAGIAVVNDDGTKLFKEKGRIAELRKVADNSDEDVFQIMKIHIHISQHLDVLH